MPTIKKYQEKQVYINKAREAEKKYGIPDNLLVGLLAQESGHFDPEVISGKRKSYAGAIGIGQFMPKTAKEYGIDPLNVDQAIDASAKYLSKSYKNLGNWDDAILSYNAGEGRVKEYRAGKPIKLKEHKEYVSRVKNQIQTYSGVKPTFAKDVAPYMNQESTTPLTNFDISIDSSNFASVPDVPQKEEKPSEALNKLKEEAFIQEYKSFYNAEQPIVQQEQETQPIQSTDVTGIFNDVSQFVDSQFAQSGGEKNSLWKNIRANRWSGKKPTKEMLEQEAKIKRNAQQGIIKDDNGYWNPDNWGKQVEISGGDITMKGVNQLLEGYSPETGERKIMFPNMDYRFPGAKRVIETPLKQNELEFLKSLR